MANGGGPTWPGKFAEHVRTIAARIEAATGHEPLYVDLTQPEEQSHTVKIICPGARSRTRRTMPR